MSSRFVRFAPSSGSDNGNAAAPGGVAPEDEGDDVLDRRPSVEDRRASFASGFGASMRTSTRRLSSTSGGSIGISFRRASSSSEAGGEQQQQQQQAAGGGAGAADGPLRVNAAIAANDGPSLAASLAQSIRHHARMIDGDQQQQQKQLPARIGARAAAAAYDPYEDDDHISLAPGVELNYGAEGSQPSAKEERKALPPPLRDYLANGGVDDATRGGDSGGGTSYDRTVEQQRARLDKLRDDSFSARFMTNLSSWFGGGGDSDRQEDDVVNGPSSRRSVRFAGDDVDGDVAAAIASGEAVPGTAFGIVGRAPKFVAPPPTSFRTATRHPSHLPDGEFADMESRLNAPRTLLAARKRHRRNDSFLRLAVAILCFGTSLAFAIIYGEGRFGMAVTNMAYERKVGGRDGDSSDQSLTPDEEEVFYPDWWEDERGIPDLEARGVRFSSQMEYNAADTSAPRAPGRIETPFFWFVPRSGGNGVRTIMSRCLRLAEASEYGAGSEAPFLRIEETEDRKFVNVDMTTTKGLEHAKELKLASSEVPDVIISGDLHGVLDVFNNRNRARIFAMLRHPLDRAISKYYADLASDPEVGSMTLPQYVRSGGHRVENNYLTRYLSGRYGGKLGVNHLDVAREVLRRKFVVGLASDLPASANLFTHSFGWNNTAASLGLENVDQCYSKIYDALSDKSPPSVEEGSEGWKLLVAQNWFDLKVYEYAEHLFQLQVDQLKMTRAAKMEETVVGRA